MGRPEVGPQERPRRATNGDTSEDTPPRVLFAIDGDQAAKVLPIVCDLVADADAELMIGSPVVLPDQTSLEAQQPRRKAERLAAQFVLRAREECVGSRPIDQVITSGHARESIVNAMIDRFDISTFITEDQPRAGIRSMLGFEAVDESAVPESCDTIIVSRIEQLAAIDSILVPVARGPHSELAIETGLALARQNQARLELLHVHTPDDEEERSKGEEVLKIASDRLNGYKPADQTLLEANTIPDTIIDHAQPFDVTVFGAPREGRLRQFMLGTIPEEVSEEAEGTVLIAHKGGADASWLDKLI